MKENKLTLIEILLTVLFGLAPILTLIYLLVYGYPF